MMCVQGAGRGRAGQAGPERPPGAEGRAVGGPPPGPLSLSLLVQIEPGTNRGCSWKTS